MCAITRRSTAYPSRMRSSVAWSKRQSSSLRREPRSIRRRDASGAAGIGELYGCSHRPMLDPAVGQRRGDESMNTRKIALALAVATACGALAVAMQAKAGGDKVSFPDGFEKGVMYATVDRYDIKQFRELYANKEAVDAVRAGKPAPSGTVLTLIQYKAKTDDDAILDEVSVGPFHRDALVEDGIVAYAVMEKRAG